jgi:hypothetical protein
VATDQSRLATLLKLAASTDLYPANSAVVVVAGAELFAVAEVEEDTSPGLVVVYLSACLVDHSYAEGAEEIQEGSYWVAGFDIVAVVVVVVVAAEPEWVEVEKLLRRPRQGLQLRRDPSEVELGKSRKRAEELDEGVRSLSRHRLWQGSSFARAHQGVAQVGAC